MKLTTEYLSQQLKKNHILTFVDNDLIIKLLPPFEGRTGYDFKHSIFIEKINENNITKESHPNLYQNWISSMSLFKEYMRRLIFYDMLSDKLKLQNDLFLSQHLINIEEKKDYLNNYSLSFTDNIGMGSYSGYEMTEARMKYYVMISQNNFKLIFPQIKIIKSSKKILQIL